MSYGDAKVVINSITYDNCDNKILIGVRKNPETEDSQTAELLLNNSDKRFTNLNLRGLSAVLSYDFGSGWTAMPTLTVVTQDDVMSGGQYQTVLNLVGIPDLLSEDKASKDYVHNATDTKTVKAMITEVLDGTAVGTTVTAVQDTVNSYYKLYSGSIVLVGQFLHITDRTISSIQFRLKKVGSPTGNITFYLRSAEEEWVEYKVLGDASTLTTEPAWKEATLDTPKAVDEDVYIYCEYVGGDEDNYVAIAYNSSGVAEGENLGYRYATGEWNLFSDQDCGYKYSYSVAGIDCFSHCTAYTATYDSEDSLIDVYTPKDSFKISEGESRLDVVNKLLDYTGCVKRVESDGEVHIFVPTTTGTTYDEEYTTEVGHNIYGGVKRKGLVIPNKIVVKSIEYDDDGVEGSATSAASYALLPITGSPIRAYVTNSTQAAAVAAAVIARLEFNAQSGSANVPIELYSQIWNYTNIVNTWRGDTSTGNIAYINRTCINGVFQQFISFGRQAKKGVAGMTPKKVIKLEPVFSDDTVLKWGMVKELFEIIDENTDDIYERLNIIFQILENMGVKVDAMNTDLSDNVLELLAGNVEYLKTYIKGVVESLWVTRQLRIPVVK